MPRAALRVARPPVAMLSLPGLLVEDMIGVQHPAKQLPSARGSLEAAAFPVGRGGQPARNGGGIANLVQVGHELQPDPLAHVVGVGAGQPVPAADRPDERGVPLHQAVPGLLVAFSRARHQVIDRRASAHCPITPPIRIPPRSGEPGPIPHILKIRRKAPAPASGGSPIFPWAFPSLFVTRHAEWARMRRQTSGSAGMTGGACGAGVPGVRVGTTEWERPARLKFAA